PCAPPPDLHSSPPRRSSDLLQAESPQAHAEQALLSASTVLDLSQMSAPLADDGWRRYEGKGAGPSRCGWRFGQAVRFDYQALLSDRKSTRLNSSHVKISYAV